MRRENVEFMGHDGTILRGWLYLPNLTSPAPGIVMSHGFSATKEMGLSGHAEAFADAGMAVLLYDHRALGQSDGTPRQLIDAFVQTRDMGCAIDWLSERTEVDRHRIGVWGTSYSGGEALILGAIDTRVRAVVGIVPFVGWPELLVAGDAGDYECFAERVRTATIDPDATRGPLAVVPDGVEADGGLMPDPPTTEWLLTEGHRSEGRWQNRVLMPARPDDIAFNPAIMLSHLRLPTLLIAGTEDRVTPEAGIRAAAALAGGAIELLALEGDHCTFYSGAPLRVAAAAARDFFRRALSEAEYPAR